MQIYNGKSVFGGIAIGKISVYQKKEQQVKRVKIDDPESGDGCAMRKLRQKGLNSSRDFTIRP